MLLLQLSKLETVVAWTRFLAMEMERKGQTQGILWRQR